MHKTLKTLISGRIYEKGERVLVKVPGDSAFYYFCDGIVLARHFGVVNNGEWNHFEYFVAFENVSGTLKTDTFDWCDVGKTKKDIMDRTIEAMELSPFVESERDFEKVVDLENYEDDIKEFDNMCYLSLGPNGMKLEFC